MHRLEMVLTQSIDLQVCHKSESQGSQNDKSDRHIERRIAERGRAEGKEWSCQNWGSFLRHHHRRLLDGRQSLLEGRDPSVSGPVL